MRIKFCILPLLLFVAFLPNTAFGMENSSFHHMAKEHGGSIFHKFVFEVSVGTNNDASPVQGWDLDGWIGTDNNKLVLKSEGEFVSHELEHVELWGLYSRNVSTFWDVQAGVRYDIQPETTTYLTLGVSGLSPYWFETEAYIFLSEYRDVTARLRFENDILLSQKFIFQPYLEANFSAQKVDNQHFGEGLVDGKIGMKVRYEFNRKFAPFLDINYSRKFGGTSLIAQRSDESREEFSGAVGLMFMF